MEFFDRHDFEASSNLIPVTKSNIVQSSLLVNSQKTVVGEMASAKNQPAARSIRKLERALATDEVDGGFIILGSIVENPFCAVNNLAG